MEFSYSMSAKSAEKLLGDSIDGHTKEPVTLHFETRGYTVTPTIHGEILSHCRIPFDVALSHVLDHVSKTNTQQKVNDQLTIFSKGKTLYIRTTEADFISVNLGFTLDCLLGMFSG